MFNITTVGEACRDLCGILYFIDTNGIEVEEDEELLPDDTRVLSVRNIENDEYEIVVDI